MEVPISKYVCFGLEVTWEYFMAAGKANECYTTIPILLKTALNSDGSYLFTIQSCNWYITLIYIKHRHPRLPINLGFHSSLLSLFFKHISKLCNFWIAFVNDGWRQIKGALDMMSVCKEHQEHLCIFHSTLSRLRVCRFTSQPSFWEGLPIPLKPFQDIFFFQHSIGRNPE